MLCKLCYFLVRGSGCVNRLVKENEEGLGSAASVAGGSTQRTQYSGVRISQRQCRLDIMW